MNNTDVTGNESLYDFYSHSDGIATDATQIIPNLRSAPVVVDPCFLFNSGVSLNQDAGCFD